MAATLFFMLKNKKVTINAGNEILVLRCYNKTLDD